MGGDSETRVIVLEEEREAVYVNSTDFFFDKIGDSVPLTPNHSPFDLQNPPSIPLAVSECFRLLFVAHPSDGFCVAKTPDVIKLAKDIKSSASKSSLLDASIVHVPLGRVSLLSLSIDSSTLAASVAGDIHFFSVQSLLHKEKLPLLSLCVDPPSRVKYFSWTKKKDTSFVALSNAGRLYCGDLKQQQLQPLKHAMDDVDAVDWSVKGEFMAVARNQMVSILTPECNERMQILLQLKLGPIDANAGGLKVDNIKWVRPDCIVLGCLQLSEVGKEENYVVQVITCRNGEEITNASSRPVVLCLSDLFLHIIDDIIPSGYGPHLILSYMEKRQLAVLANRKNIDEHIVLVGWLDDNDGPSVILIERDNWLPRIELQENGDDNVLLGMCIDRACVYEDIQVQNGVDDHIALSPHCIFLCLTNEGKLVIFHYASIAGDSDALCSTPDPAEDVEAISTTGYPDWPTISVEQKDDKIKQVVLDLESHDMSKDNPATIGVDQNFLLKNREKPFNNKSTASVPVFDQTSATTTGNWTTTCTGQLGPIPRVETDKRLGSEQLFSFENERLNQDTLQGLAADASKTVSENFKEVEKRNFVGHMSDLDPADKNFAISSDVSHGDKSMSFVDSGNREPRNNHQPTFLKDVLKQGITNLPGSLNYVGAMAINTNKATSVPKNVTMGTHGMQVQGSLLPGKSLSQVVHPIHVNPKTPSQSTHSNFELSLSKKYGNMKDMTSELDKLLQCIEQPGGFMDACTSSQKSFENLEEAIIVSCKKCTTWQDLLHEQAESIHHLLDNTVQVLARKIYMEGIVKQTRDKQYWDLWNRQKLSSELQMKRQSMINLSQDLVNQLIELEKHFNALELNNYGESNEVNFGCQSSRIKYAPSRRIHSLHAVHNSLNFQLAAAEQLSESLSRQMAVLSITSPSVKPDKVKDQLFKMIGLTRESHSETSSQRQKVLDTDAAHATPLFSSVGATTGNDFKSNRTGTIIHEPETARRRRDSFDQNWASFEPSKTTIKRILRGNERPNAHRPSLSTDKRFSISSNAEGALVSSINGHATQSVMLNDPRGTEDTYNDFSHRGSSTFSRNKDLYELSAPSVDKASGKLIIDRRNLGAFSPDPSKCSGVLDFHVTKDTNIEKADSVFFKEKRTGFTAAAQTSQDQPYFERAQSPVFPFSGANDALMAYNNKDNTSTKRAGDVEEKVSRSSPTGSGNFHEVKSFPIPSLSDQSGTWAQLAAPASRIQSSEVTTTSSTTIIPSTSLSVVGSATKSLLLSSSTPTTNKFLSTNVTGASNSTTDNQVKLRSASQPTRLTFSSAASAASFSSPSATKSIDKASSSAFTTDSSIKPLLDAPTVSSFESHPSISPEMSASSPLAFSVNTTFNIPNTANQPSASKGGAGILQKELPTSATTFTGFSDAASTALFSGSHFKLSSSAAHGQDVVTKTEAEMTAGLFSLPHAQSLKSEDFVVAQEDEMDEEAPDTTQTPDFGFGNLGGLGSGSGVSTSAAFRPNPFGASTVSTSGDGAISTMDDMAIPSGQLFRPASLNFQTLQPSQQPQMESASGFGFGTQIQVPSAVQPAQIGSGQQALGSVLGTFGQSRQLGPALQGTSFGGGGFAGGGGQPGGGFPTASATGGFAGVSATAGGFAGAGATGGGFGGAPTGGGGFGAFSNQGGGSSGGGGFTSFGSGAGGKQTPSLFTQMRK